MVYNNGIYHERNFAKKKPTTKNIRSNIMCRGVPRIWEGGAKKYFFQIWNLHVTKRHAAHGEAMRFARGVRGHAPLRIFFKIVQFGPFWCIFGSDFVFKKFQKLLFFI